MSDVWRCSYFGGAGDTTAGGDFATVVLSNSTLFGSCGCSYAATMSSEWPTLRLRSYAGVTSDADHLGTLFFLRQRMNRKTTSSRIAVGIATPSPIFASVERPFVDGTTIVLSGGDVVVSEVVEDVVRVTEVAAGSKALEGDGVGTDNGSSGADSKFDAGGAKAGLDVATPGFS
jgi:hypothetical protein